MAVVVVPVMLSIVIFVGVLVIGPRSSVMRKRGYDAEVKSILKNAATSQEAYFVDNGTYTNKIGSLRGFNQSAIVNITMKATGTTFVITGTVTKGCKVNTGTWYINSTTGAIDGAPCSRVGIFRKLFLRLLGGN